MRKIDVTPVRKPVLVVLIEPAKILGGIPDGSGKVAAGSKQVGSKIAR